jgi:hypothetical protein
MFTHFCVVDGNKQSAAERGSFLSFHPLNRKSPSSAASALSQLTEVRPFLTSFRGETGSKITARKECFFSFS